LGVGEGEFCGFLSICPIIKGEARIDRMWITEISGKKTEMEEISHCFMFFPQFHHDFNVLFENGIIKRIAFDHYEWTKSKTSLAEYFKWIGITSKYIPGGFWDPIVIVFGKRNGKTWANNKQLAKLASGNANPLKPEESKDFKIIKKLVLQYRECVKLYKEQYQKELETFKKIKKIIMKTDNETPQKINSALKKIKAIMN